MPIGGSAPTTSTASGASPISSSASRSAVVSSGSSGWSRRPPGNEISPAWRRRSWRRSVKTRPGSLGIAEDRHQHRRLGLAVGVHRLRLLGGEQRRAQGLGAAQMITCTVPPSTDQAAPAT